MAVSYPLYITPDAADSAAPPLAGVTVSSTTTYYSKVWGRQGSDGQAIQLEWTGTPTGTFTLWWTSNPYPNEADDADWIEDTDFAPTNPAGSASKMGDNTAVMKGNLKRIKYVNASGTGVLKGNVTVG